MVPFEEIIDELQEMLDEAWNLPMTGGKCVLDGEKVRENLEGLRLNFPGEIKRAKSVLDERERIILKAKSDAIQMIKNAEQRAEIILNEQAIMREARDKAELLVKTAQDDSIKMKKAAADYLNGLLKKTEELLDNNLAAVRQTRRTINGEKE